MLIEQKIRSTVLRTANGVTCWTVANFPCRQKNEACN